MSKHTRYYFDPRRVEFTQIYNDLRMFGDVHTMEDFGALLGGLNYSSISRKLAGNREIKIEELAAARKLRKDVG